MASKPNRPRHLPPATRIDRRHSRRVVPMEVLVLGLCRTGTKSIQTALLELGYNHTYHMGTAVHDNPLDCDLWIEAISAKYDGKGRFTKEKWDGLLGHCMAVTDLPCAAFAQELIATYPNAKVILSNRDVDSWYRSTSHTVFPEQSSILTSLLSLFDADFKRTRVMPSMLFDRLFEGDFPNNGKRVFKEHYDHVRRLMSARPGDLLEYEVKQGWGPLCRFLGKPVPEQDFPRVNDSADFKVWVGIMRRQQAVQLAKALLPMITLLLGAVLGVLWAM